MDMMRRLSRCLAVLATAVALVACGGGGDSPPPSVPQVPIVTNGGVGTSQSPAEIQVGPVYPSTAGVFASSYYTFVSPTTGSYLITLSNPTFDVEWELFPDKTYSSTNRVKWCDAYSVAAAESCIVKLNAGARYYLVVETWNFSLTDTIANFGLQVKHLTNEGTTFDPVSLTVDVPHTGSVAAAGSSYYRFTTSTAGSYSIALTNEIGYWDTMKIYAVGFGPSPLIACTKSSSSVCTAGGLAAGTSYYVEVLGHSSEGASYTMTVGKGVSQGSVTNPVTLVVDAPTLHAGAVDNGATSYYTFTTSDAGEYLMNFANTAGLSAQVFSSTDFSGSSVKWCVSGECRISGLNGSAKYYVIVRNTTAADQTFQIGIKRGITEGSVQTPVPLTLGTPHTATASPATGGRYSFLTSNFAGAHTISVTSTQTDMKWELYKSPQDSFAYQTCNTSALVADETCTTINLEPNTTYYLAVVNLSPTTTGAYTVNVVTGGGSQGTVNHPVDLGVIPPSGMTYSLGSITESREGYSDESLDGYYKFTVGPSAAAHVISLLNTQTDLEWSLKPGLDLVSSFDCNDNSSVTENICSTQGYRDSYDDTTPGMLNANTTYYLHVNNRESKPGTFKIAIVPLIPSAGCVGSYNECLNFESGMPALVHTSTQTGTKGNWSLDSSQSGGPGVSSLVSGTLVDYGATACVSYTPAIRPSVVSFNFLTQNVNLEQNVWENGVIISSTNDYTGGNWKRNTYRFPAGTALLKFEWCYQRSSWYEPELIRMDDIEFE